jgi:hypothetical protein
MIVSKSPLTALTTLKMLNVHNVLLDIGSILKEIVIYSQVDVSKLMMQESVVFANKDISLTDKETVNYYQTIVSKLMIMDSVYNV